MKRGTIRREFEVPEGLRVEILGEAGDVALHAGSERKALVEVHYTVRGWGSRAEAVEQDLKANPPVRYAQGALRVGPEPEGVELDYALHLPPEAEIAVEVGAGDVAARGFAKRLRISTDAGDVDLAGITGEVRVRCGSGDIKLNRVFGAVSLHTGSGDVQGGGIKGDLEIEAGAGDVALADVEGELRILTGSGDVKIEGELREEMWRIRTGSGDVHIKLPGGSQAELDLRTEFGDIVCRFPFFAQEQREGRLRGELGQAPRARIQVETRTGDIVLSPKEKV